MIELADAVDLVRTQLAEAARRAMTQPSHGVILNVDSVQVSLGVEIGEQTEGKGGLNVWVFTIGAGKAESVSTTHTVTLTLNPLDQSGRPLKVAAAAADAPRPPGT
jgi:Trypsin-co-occurring domain 2